MMWLEENHLRVADQDCRRLMPTFTQFLDEIREKKNCRMVKLFRRVLFETDVCFHLYHDSPHPEDGGSPVGLCLVNALKPLGMVNHTVWTEVQETTA